MCFYNILTQHYIQNFHSKKTKNESTTNRPKLRKQN